MFWFRLAQELGMSVKRAQQEIDSAEFSEWLAYNTLNPFGDERRDFRAAMIASTTANVQGNKTTIDDFMPVFDADPEEAKRRSQDGIMNILKVAAGMAGVKVITETPDGKD
jgi:hypothetical protein